ncbi:ISXO2-like transposase domain family protein (plasmid) [Rhizobium leguminosarum]|uniref:ISXO2-like transposase domain family protein n=1 Tax=Rhizobium leguminosarum TaxID=384 RepID=A0A2Z4YUG8_RHILE|nr:ISXO2-like transposase domain family protein [Rhizobium leguminosarum]
MWLLLQSDKGLSSVRLAETLGVSQPTAWRIGHALRLIVARENMLDGTVEIDHFYLGGRPRKRSDEPPPGRGRKGQAKTEKTPVMAIVQRPVGVTPGSAAGDARAAVVTGLSLRVAVGAIATQVGLHAHLISDEAKAFMAIGESFAAHETVNHSSREYVRDAVHVNSDDGFNARSAEPSQVFFITSARNLPTYISMKSASAGLSGSLPARLCEKAEMAGKA